MEVDPGTDSSLDRSISSWHGGGFPDRVILFIITLIKLLSYSTGTHTSDFTTNHRLANGETSRDLDSVDGDILLPYLDTEPLISISNLHL